MESKLVHIVTNAQNGMILRDLLRRELAVSAKLLARIKRVENGIVLNGKSVFVNVPVHTGDTVEISLEYKSVGDGNLIPQAGELDIRYEDDDLLIVNKPAGMPVIPAIGDNGGSLGNIIVWHYMQKREGIIYRPINRLDSGTSGLMTIAKNSHMHTLMAEKLHTGDFRRTYKAIVHGVFSEKTGSVEAPIGRVDGSVIKRCVSADGKWAKTNYTVLESMSGCSLVSLQLESGRTHQIRVHMSHTGHPLVGDFLYGKEEPELIERFALHSAEIEFTHPISNAVVYVECELPEDMRRLIDRLK